MTDIEKVISEGKAVQIKPEGYSMYPMLFPGRDEVIIGGVNVNEIRKNDVILYRRKDGMLILHRVVKVKKDGIYLLGDNQEDIEGPLSLECVRGRLLAFIRNGREISSKNLVYRFFAMLWLVLRPIRKPIKRTLAYIKRKLR